MDYISKKDAAELGQVIKKMISVDLTKRYRTFLDII